MPQSVIGVLVTLLLSLTLLGAVPSSSLASTGEPLTAPLTPSAPAPSTPTRAATAPACQVYTGCLPTRTALRHRRKVARGTTLAICAKTVVRGSMVLPKGRLKISVRRKAGGFTLVRTRAYDGGARCLRTTPLQRRGIHVVRAKFVPAKKSVFLRSARKRTVKVVG